MNTRILHTVYVRMRTCMFTCIFILCSVQLCSPPSVGMCICINVYIHIHKFIYVHAHTKAGPLHSCVTHTMLVFASILGRD